MKMLHKLYAALALILVLHSPAHAREETQTAPKELYIAMTAAFVSDNGTDIYKDIATYISNKTGISTHMISGLSYETVDNMIKDGAVQIAFMCGYPYVLTKDKQGSAVNLMAAPVMENESYGGKPVYYSYIIVKSSSPANSFKALKGQRFVYNESTSNSGYNMPRAKLI